MVPEGERNHISTHQNHALSTPLTVSLGKAIYILCVRQSYLKSLKLSGNQICKCASNEQTLRQASGSWP